MKKSVNLLACATACSLALASFAVTPVAVWDRDFTTLTQGTYTLSENGNTREDGYLQVSGDNGILFTSTDALNVFTVIMRCEGLNLGAEKAQVLFTSYGADASTAAGINDNMTGVNLPANNAVCRGIWAGADWNDGATQGSVPANYTTLIYNHQQTNGTYAYALGPTSDTDDTVVCTTLYSVVKLRSSGTTYKGFAIGGLRGTTSTTLLPATGLKITSIAVFSGTLTEAEMKEYAFPSETQTIDVSANTSVSAINAQYDSTSYKAAKVTVASGVTITVDAAFNEKIQSVSSTGSITLSAASQPDASYNLANVDFSGVKGGLLRSWLTPGVVGFNFRSQNGTDVSGALATADNWIHDSNSASGTSTAMFADGLSTLKWSSANTWACSGSTIISGYLDDGANGGNGATVTLSNVPYETYDVIVYCSSDSNPGKFLAKTVNGTTYTWDSTAGAVVAGSSVWGTAALSTPVYGVNALRIKNLTGPLTIYGTARNGSNRGGIAAFEIMPPETPDNIPTYTLTLNGTATTWSGGTWTLNNQTVDAPVDGYVEIVATASTSLTVDQAVNLADLKVRGDTNIVINVATNDTGSLYAIKATVESGVFQQGSPAVLGATPSIVVASGATFDENGMAVNAANAVTIVGAGAGNWPWALTSSSGAGGAILGGLYLSANATIGGENELKIGQYSLNTGYHCYLQGHTLTKIGEGALTCNNMNTPGTGSIDVQGGAMSVNAFNNLNNNGGDTTVILNSGTSLTNGTDRIVPMAALELRGGTLSTDNRAFRVKTNLRGAGETANLAFGAGASALLTGDLTVTATMTLDGDMTFTKDDGATSDVVVTPATLAASTGTITVGAGVTFNVGTNRPNATLTIDDDGVLAVKMADANDVPEFLVSAEPAQVTLYDVDGNVTASYTEFNDQTGILSVHAGNVKKATVGTPGETSQYVWSDVGWSGDAPTSGDVILTVYGNVELSVDMTVDLSHVIIKGDGTITIKPDQANNVTFTAESVDTVIRLVLANDGVGITTLTGPVTYGYRTTSVESSGTDAYSNVYEGGSGTEADRVAILHQGGSVILDGTAGTPYYLKESNNATDTTVVITNATVKYSDCLGVGAATYIVAGDSVVDTATNYNNQSFVLSQGGAGRASVFLLKDEAVVNVGGTNDDDSNKASVMFGHWNGPSTFIIQDSAAFNAECQVLVGKTANNQTINLNGGTFKAKGIKASANASGTNILNLGGGLAVLGESGITSYGSTVINVNVRDDSEIRASAATTPITQPVSFPSGKTLSFTKADSLASARVDLTGAVSGTGGISVGAGVTLNLGTNRPADATFTVDGDGVLALVLADKTETPVLKVSAEPAHVTVYDTDGTTELGSKASVEYDAVAGTITIRLNTNTWEVQDDFSFDTAANWSRGLPVAGQELAIYATSEVTLTIAGTYTATSLLVYGGGNVTFAGEGSLTVDGLYLSGDTALNTGGKVSATTSIEVTAGSTLTVPGTGFSLADGGLTGAGTFVLDPGAGNTVTMSKSNTSFTGEAVIASGTVKMGDARSFGEFGRSASIRVKTGATLDANGVSNGGVYLTGNNKIILEEGATFTNSVGLGDTKGFAFHDIRAEGNATIDASTTHNGLARFYNYPTHIDLGANTLTKTGSDIFYLSAPTIDGTGTIDVTAGTLNLTCDYWGGTHPTFRNGTLIIRTGAALNLAPYSGNAYFVPNLTVNKIVLEDTGHISGTGTVAAAGGAEFRMINTNAMEYSTFLTDDTPVTVTGAGVFSFGTIRPTLSVVIGEEVGITVTMRHDAETLIELPLSRNPASVTVYDTDGNVDESASATYDAGTGILTIALEAITLEATSGTVSFDEPASWNIGRVPAEGEDVVLRATGDVTVSISHDYNLGDVTVSGGGSLSFTGNGSVTTEHVYIVSDTTLGHGGQIKATNVNVEAGSVFVLDAGDGTLTETTVISGDGAVETYGNVTFDANNAFTGGLTVKPGSTARTTKQQGFGKNNYGQAIANLSRIVVEDGGSLDLKNTQNACYAITIAGKGVEEDGVYSGALFNSGTEMGDNTRQTASLTLTADALVKAEMSTNGWGIVNSGHAAALLALNGHTLTVSGKGYFPLVNVNTASGTTTTGTLVADGVTLGLPAVASDLSGVTVIALGGSKFTLGVAPKAISAVTIASTATEGVTVEGYANMTNVVPVVTTANINVFSLEVGATITNMTTDVALTAGENVTIVAGSRYTTTVSGQNVVTKVKALSEMTPFLHYDFNNGATDETGKASDSSAQLAFGGEAGSITQVSSRNSKAAWVHTGYTPWWNTNSADKSPLYAGEVTVATVAKFKETGIVLWGLGTTAAEAMGLVVGDDGTSVSAVARDASGSIVTLATLTDLENLTVGWHYVAVSANAHATMLYVDGTSVTSATGVSSAIGQQGQLGSFHGGVIGGDKVSEKGYYLDDWCVWDAALKATELRGLKTRYAPDPFVLHIR